MFSKLFTYNNYMNELVNYIQENSRMIMLIMTIVFILLVIIKITGINLNIPKQETKLVQEVTVETLNTLTDNIELNSRDNFCKSYLGNTLELESECNKLTKTNCIQTPCCVFTQTSETGKCMAGNIDGPIYKTDKDGKLITIDSYYYMGKHKGK